MKKILCVLISVLSIVSLTACGLAPEGENSQFGTSNPAFQEQDVEENSLGALLEGIGSMTGMEELEELEGLLEDLEDLENLYENREDAVNPEDRSYRVEGYDIDNMYGSVPEPPEGISFRNTRFFDKKSKWTDNPPVGEGGLGNSWELEFYKVEFDCSKEKFGEWLTAFQNWGWLAQEDTSDAEKTCWYLYFNEDYYAVMTYSADAAQGGYELGCQLYVQPAPYELPYAIHGVPMIEQGILPFPDGVHECYDEEGNYLDKEFSIETPMEEMPYEWTYSISVEGLTLEDVHNYRDYLVAWGWPLIKAQEPLEPIYEMWDEAHYDYVKGDYYVSLSYYLGGYVLVINMGKVVK